MVNHKIQANAIKTAIEKSKTILLIGHKKPDADTLGSVCAWISLLNSKGKHVEAFCLDPVPEQLSHLPGSDLLRADPEVFKKDVDLIIINDSGSLDYAGVDIFLANRDKTKTTLVNVDHHSTNPHYGDINLVIPDASSTTEVICRLFTHWQEEITKPIAEALLNGLITDTDSLTNPATSYHSLATASMLVKAGADLHDIVKRTLHAKSISDLKLWGIAMSRLKHNPTYNSVATFIRHEEADELGTSETSFEGIQNYLTLIPDVDVIMVLKTQKDGSIKGSLRTTKKHIDVGQLALLFGGGGHKKASGFRVMGELQVSNNDWTIV
ncbi:MAG: bifunctional oligoribonuclease/PAP phosphatase NrnA [Candidatus Komeilibacteria bacterium]|nr:bifunctional oligoribonuclease/PAP phosphatase NrnA [Candidatus Komeilibacteria bacterium]